MTSILLCPLSMIACGATLALDWLHASTAFQLAQQDQRPRGHTSVQTSTSGNMHRAMVALSMPGTSAMTSIGNAQDDED